MGRSAEAWLPSPANALAPSVHPAVAELVPAPIVQPSDGLDLLRAARRPRLTHVLVFDTETTGRDANARIVELAIAKVDLTTGLLVSARTTLVHPGCPIPRDASAIHGINDATVRGAPSVAEVLPKALAMVVRSGLPMVAHNASFDLARIRHDAARTGVRLPGEVPVYCSLGASRKLRRERGHSLSAIAQRYGVTVTDTHRALADVVALAAVLPHLLREPAAASRCLRDCFPLEAML